MNLKTLSPSAPPVATKPQPALIVMGRDKRGRAHASTFTPDEVPAAEQAAKLMGMHIILVGDEHDELELQPERWTPAFGKVDASQ